MIELQQVTKAYGPAPGSSRTVRALEEITLQIPTGATWAVVGPNGAGKSTLFALILGFLHPTTGRVRLAQLPPRTYLRRHGAAFLPERFQLPGEWSVAAGLRALAQLEGLHGEAAGDRVDYALERFGLAPHAAKPLATLSRGLLQRVGLAQTLLGQGRLVILDEPTEGLDPIWRIQFRELVNELRRDGRTILIASHDLAEVERVAEQAVLLEAGRIREILPVRRPAQTTQRYRITLVRPTPAVAELFAGASVVRDPAAAVPIEPAPVAATSETTNLIGAPNAKVATGAASEMAKASEPVATGTTYIVEVADYEELSARLAALLAAGATLIAAEPDTEPLEERIQQALGGGIS
jgi:ABC-type multidrug transport system ATPase subunit